MVFRIAALMVGISVAIFGAIGLATQVSVDAVLRHNSIDKAMRYADYMSYRIPGLEHLVADPMPTEEQIDTIRNIRQLGDVFRFKLFDVKGHLLLTSDDDGMSNRGTYFFEPDAEPEMVARTGMPMAEVFDGSAKPDRPEFYAEAYVPLVNVEGEIFGVLEVYVDETNTRSYFYRSFKTFGIVVSGFCILLFGTPYAGYLIQRALARNSKKDAKYLASYDPLTGLINRREFVRQANRVLSANTLTAICAVDLDRIKSINDVYGHTVGDKFLKHIAKILRDAARSKDLVCRFGGDEFILGFNGLGLEEVTKQVRKIVVKSAEEFRADADTIMGTISLGIAVRNQGQSLDQLLSQADAALYHAKKNGRNTFAIYGDKMGEELRWRNSLKNRLRLATANKDFKIVYQPLVDSIAKDIVGYEALLRLEDGQGNDIPPSQFIPVAEELGLITDIGSWVIKTATREIAQLSSTHFVAVNLSAAQFWDGDLLDIVKEALSSAGLAAGRLELEITESLLLEDDPKIEFQIDALKEIGISIAMDDFGTGFSSLSYLWRFGFDRLKIDRSFVAALDCDPIRAKEIIETILMLGSRLGMRTTAEGIETLEQSDLLSSLGCDLLQGYFFGYPVELFDLEQAKNENMSSRAIQSGLRRSD